MNHQEAENPERLEGGCDQHGGHQTSFLFRLVLCVFYCLASYFFTCARPPNQSFLVLFEQILSFIFSFCTMFFSSSLFSFVLSCSRPNGYHLKCYLESKRVCQLMRLVPGCRLTRLNTSPANTNTSGFTLFLNSNDKKLRNKIR